MASLNDVSVYRCETVQLNFTMTPTTDITGWTTSFCLKATPGDAALLTVPGAIVSAGAGTFKVNLSKTNLTLPAGVYVYDVQRTDSGSEAVLSIGNFNLRPSVLYP